MMAGEQQITAHENTSWQNPNFRKLWGAESISMIGSEVTSLGVPLTAALTLEATPLQMGLLGAAGQAPSLLLGLLAGVWVDRVRRKRLLIWSDLLRAALLISVPVAAWLGVLGMVQLYLVMFLVGTFTICFDVAHAAYMPALLPKRQLLDANSKLQVSHSAANSAGPGLGGLLVQGLTAPLALLFDATTFLVSALFLARIRTAEAPLPPRQNPNIVREVKEGLRALLGHPLLRPIGISSVLIMLPGGAVGAQYILFASRELNLNPACIGLIAAAGGLGAIPGAFLTRWASSRFGVGRVIVGGWLGWTLMGLAVPLVSGPIGYVVAILLTTQILGSLTYTVANVQQWSLRQIVTPDTLLGRVTANQRFLVYGAEAIGALMGGFLASAVGLRATILVCSIGMVLGVLPALFSPLARLRDMPLQEEA